ncbi:MAG: hypothetical protein ACSLEM_04685 [Candidatus Malihini olakiniferum]
MKQALENAGLKSEDIQYVNANETSTRLNDVNEAKLLKKILDGMTL